MYVLHLIWIAFGPSTWGAGGNMLAWVLCGGIAFSWQHSRIKKLNVQRMAQAAQHHSAVMAELKTQALVAEQHHQETHRRLGEHAELISAAAKPPEPMAAAAEKVVRPRRSNGGNT